MVSLRFLYRVKTMEPNTWAMDADKPWHRDWRTLSGALLVSSVGIFVSVRNGLERPDGVLTRSDDVCRSVVCTVSSSCLRATTDTSRRRRCTSMRWTRCRCLRRSSSLQVSSNVDVRCAVTDFFGIDRLGRRDGRHRLRSAVCRTRRCEGRSSQSLAGREWRR